MSIPCVPYRLESDRLVLRALELADASPLFNLVQRDRAYLARWMPWARDEPTLDGYVAFVKDRRAAFDRDEDYGYGLFDPGTGALVGSAGLHRRCGPGGLEVGYWIAEQRAGKGLATEAAAVLTRAALGCPGIVRVELRVQEENRASLRVAEKLGFNREGLLRRRLAIGGEWVDLASYSMLPEELPTSLAGSFDYRAYDALGREL
jgi:RimJ/RimL family protein N-acetyltransferase